MARRVVVLGGGFAGLESAFLLRHRLHDDVHLTLVSDDNTFLFRPNTIYVPFGADPDQFRVPLREPCDRQGIELVHARAVGIDVAARRVHLSSSSNLSFDDLIVATGAAMRPSEIPGLADFGNPIWTPHDMQQLGRSLTETIARARAGQVSRILFLIPPNNKCAGPLYELVFMVDTHLRREGVREAIELVWTTCEHAYIQAFGPKIDEVVEGEFQERRIVGYRDWEVVEVLEDRVRYRNGEEIPYDLLVAFPPYVAAVDFDGLPTDDRGFIRTESPSRSVLGVEGIYAPGDAGDFPVKQAFLAFLQADAVAEDIIGAVRGKPPRIAFDPVSMCVMEQFDKAVFAQVPLRLTGDPQRPVEVRPDAGSDYRVGVSPAWRLGKKMLGFYLPMRFRAGEPFHAGSAWTMMELGLKGMSGVLSH
ncbi:MAG: FAD-dependent oxidoreductase [Gemmatimonadota bacterium]